MDHEYALWGFDDRNRPVAREGLTIEAVNAVRDEKNLRTYHINPMQGDPDTVDPPRRPPANRSFVRLADGSYQKAPSAAGSGRSTTSRTGTPQRSPPTERFQRELRLPRLRPGSRSHAYF